MNGRNSGRVTRADRVARRTLLPGPIPDRKSPPVPAYVRRSGALRTAATAALGLVLAFVLAGSLGVAPAAAATDSPEDQLAPLRAEQAWRHSTGAGVVVAVLDSGVDASHPDLAGRVLPGRDYVDGSTDGREDPVGHGTAVASLIAGGSGTGLAPDAMILPVRVLDDDNRYDSSATVASAVIWAVEQGAQVINLSLGGKGHSERLSRAIAFAMANDVVVVACTGNAREDGPDQVWFPAREPGVIAVAGLTWSDAEPEHWPRSLTGPETVLSAPAVMVGARPGGGYRQVQGTSFAAALVAATAALIRSRWPEASAGDVVHRLVATADDLGEPGRDHRHGFGALNPVTALTARVPSVHANPLDTRARHGHARLVAAPTPAEHGPDVLSPGGAVVLAADPPPTLGGAAAPVAAVEPRRFIGPGRGSDRVGTAGHGSERGAQVRPAATTHAAESPGAANEPATTAAAGLVPAGSAAVAGLTGLALVALLAGLSPLRYRSRCRSAR
jgi:type VII secretion-associated serine protease mycosin